MMPVRLRFIPWFCGLPCDPMRLEVRGDRLVAVDGGCPACRGEVALFRKGAGSPRIAGKNASTEKAVEAAVRILRAARAPFVYGLSRSSSSTARRAAAVAAAIGGAVDVEGSETIQADLTALWTFGLPSATFGEIRDRADLLLLWRCDPRRTHPGLFGRAPRGGESRPSARRVILVPPPEGPAAGGADLILPVKDGGDLDAALSLRALLNGAAPHVETPGEVGLDVQREAAGMLRRARYSAIVWDKAATASGRGVAIASTLTLLARDLNRETRSVVRPLGAGANVAGAVAALAAATGYPRAVGFAGGAPRFAPGDLEARGMIGEGGADALLLVGARAFEVPAGVSGGRPGSERTKDDTGDPAPRDAHRARRGRPGIVVIGPRLTRGVDNPDVWIPTATPGLSAAGTAMRADGMTVVLRALVATRLPTEDDVLDALKGYLTAGKRSRRG